MAGDVAAAVVVVVIEAGSRNMGPTFRANEPKSLTTLLDSTLDFSVPLVYAASP